ncbi:hypothetical protein DPMN_019955 [Dreissena polymorpha]|uniref:Uncharacterized protein n=1 Tax=Dreissena polymorpha TaxID=45954 RepID=A0A9D4NLQ0_DREPO|nr:hypothetical protein DPMN_019955 [Dreissena polymorpha]
MEKVVIYAGHQRASVREVFSPPFCFLFSLRRYCKTTALVSTSGADPSPGNFEFPGDSDLKDDSLLHNVSCSFKSFVFRSWRM